MYFEDLSPYRYGTFYGKDRIIPLPEVFHVGWLENGHDYPKGEMDAQTLSNLRYLITKVPNIRRLSRGYHFCDFCPQDQTDDGLAPVWWFFRSLCARESKREWVD